MKEKINQAEKRILELTKSGDLKKLPDALCNKIFDFYEKRSLNRLETAKIIFDKSNKEENYSDYGEVVTSAYYSMYYIVHAYLAKNYKTKLRENLRGVHSITHKLILYYLVKTKKLAKHLYEEYINTLETTVELQKISIEDFQKEAYEYAERYDKSRSAREVFTYNLSSTAESHHAEKAISIAEEFINTIRQLMI